MSELLGTVDSEVTRLDLSIPTRMQFAFTELSWRQVNQRFLAKAAGGSGHGLETIQSPTDTLPLEVLDRDMYVHVDAARCKGMVASWGTSCTVIKWRLSGLNVGLKQSSPPNFP